MTVPWRTIREQFAILAAACKACDKIDTAWRDFVGIVRRSESEPPSHLKKVLACLLEMSRNDGRRESIAILDHGTGTAVNILYLAALGYTNVWGANVVPKAQPQNRVFREILDDPAERIFLYDGRRLPLPDASIDLVISQQVVEHLPDSVIDIYYQEEGRVLTPGGRALHQVPHRWMPYDAHTRTWFLTYLPEKWRTGLWKRLAANPEQIGHYLFLRSRRDHLERAQRFIGETMDQSLTQLTSQRDYEGPAALAMLRRFAGLVASIPGIGNLVRTSIRPISMLETQSIKR